jgi:predicted TIM-barrel fold metal-dependent hydrolase
MQDPHESALEVLDRVCAEVIAMRPPGCAVVDAHTHLGQDIDGQSLAPADHIAEMDATGISRAVVFPLNEPDREPAYRAPNDRVLRWAAEDPDRFIPFCRLSLDEHPLAEAERCMPLGARGIKLHPRAQAFRVNDRRFDDVFAFAAERRLPVLIHAGRGLPEGMATELAHVADRHPEASLILAHAAIVDQTAIAEYANGHPNIYFDTSTWTPLDILSLFARVGPEQVLYASDVPYGNHVSSQHTVLRLMRHEGMSDELQRGVMGDTVVGLCEGRRPERISAPAAAARLEVSYDRMRVHNYLAAATPLLWFGHEDLVGFLGLARGSCLNGDGKLEPVGELIQAGEAAWRGALAEPDADASAQQRRTAFKLLNLAQAMALLA